MAQRWLSLKAAAEAEEAAPQVEPVAPEPVQVARRAEAPVPVARAAVPEMGQVLALARALAVRRPVEHPVRLEPQGRPAEVIQARQTR
ncbi:MAG: hypothetical protein ACJ8EE_09595 [Bradyrhizobium sp.]